MAHNDATVFISYSRKDMAFVDRLDTALRQRGITTLIDRAEIEIGEPWLARLQDLIAQAETVLFVLSPDSVSSNVCAQEVEFGSTLRKRFIPIVARRVDDSTIPKALSELNYVFLDQEVDYESRIDKLVAAVRTDLSWVRAHADLGRAARHWIGAERPASLLLSAARLRAAEIWLADRPANAPPPSDATRELIRRSSRAARQRRRALIGALMLGIVVSLALAGVAYYQRSLAESARLIADEQTNLAVKREAETRVQRDRAEDALKRSELERSNAETMRDVASQSAERLNKSVLGVLEALNTSLSDVSDFIGELVKSNRFNRKSAHDVIFKLLTTRKNVSDLAQMRVKFNASSRFEEAITLVKASSTLIDIDAHREALTNLTEAEAILRELVARGPDQEQEAFRDSLATVLDLKGDAFSQQNNYNGAISAYRESLVVLAQGQEAASDTPQRHSAYTLMRLARAHNAQGDRAVAASAVARAQRIICDRLASGSKAEWRAAFVGLEGTADLLKISRAVVRCK